MRVMVRFPTFPIRHADTSPLFSRDVRALAWQMRLCRYVVYTLLIVLVGITAWLEMRKLNAALVMLMLLPVLVHWLQSRTAPAGWVWVAVLEALAGFALLVYLQAPLIVSLLFALALVASGTALWGVASAAVLAPVAGLMWAGWLAQPDAYPHEVILFPGSFDLVVVLLATSLVVAINGVIRGHVLHLLQHGKRLHSQRQQLLRYLPDEVGTRVKSGELGHTQRDWYTVALIDLSGFTHATETLPAEALHTLLSDFLGEATVLVEDLGGDVVKFLGDGLLCVFPCAETQSRGAVAARCVAGLTRLPIWMQALNQRWQAQGFPHHFAVSAGVASGYCTYGEWGNGARLDYTLIGSAVNLASRLQHSASAGRPTGGSGALLIDPVTAQIITPYMAPGTRVSAALKGSAVTCAYQPLPV